MAFDDEAVEVTRFLKSTSAMNLKVRENADKLSHCLNLVRLIPFGKLLRYFSGMLISFEGNPKYFGISSVVFSGFCGNDASTKIK